MKKSCLSTTLSLLLFLSSANSGVLARVAGGAMYEVEFVSFCRKIINLFEKNYEPVLFEVTDSKNAKPIALKEPIFKQINDMSNMVKSAKTTECIAFSSYALRLLEEYEIASGFVLLDKFGDPKNGHSVVVYKREVEVQGKKMEKWFVCDLSSAFWFWTRSKIMMSSKAKDKTLDAIGLKDSKNVLKSTADFLSIPLLYYFDDMGASKIYDAPSILDCDSHNISTAPMTAFLDYGHNNTFVGGITTFKSTDHVQFVTVDGPRTNIFSVGTSDYHKKIINFFTNLEDERSKRIVNTELLKKGIDLNKWVNLNDVSKVSSNKFGNK